MHLLSNVEWLMLKVTSFGSTQAIGLWSLYLISTKTVFINANFSFMVPESLIGTVVCSFSLCRRTYFELHFELSIDILYSAGSTFRSTLERQHSSLLLLNCPPKYSHYHLYKALKKCRNWHFVRMAHNKKG